MAPRRARVLILCTGNSARSILGEALLDELGKGRFRAYSAGSHPRGEVNPMTLEVLRAAGIATEGLRSKSWDEFAQKDAPAMDAVITVCDNAANEVCPVWSGHPATMHWSIEDPAAVEGSDERRRAAFERATELDPNYASAWAALGGALLVFAGGLVDDLVPITPPHFV